MNKPSKKYQWTVLPQGMKNSLTIYQLHVSGATQRVPKAVLVVHYKDDIILAYPSLSDLERVSSQLLLHLEKINLKVAPKRFREVPHIPSWTFFLFL